MRFGELFAGAGGLSHGLERAGLECAWHAEWDENPRTVLRHRWPNVPLYGDVTTLDGAALVAAHGPIDILTGGSPCQDLSVAGKRKGLEGSRSSLFHHQIRLWSETGVDLCLWENVYGALSSNDGKDFGIVLGAFVGAAVPVPSDGWASAGVVAGPSGVAAWRCLDCQWFGPPQRRLRVFILGTRTGSIDPAAVLLEPEGVRGNPPTRREAGQRVADTLTDGASQTCGFPGDDQRAAGACDAARLGTIGMGVLQFILASGQANAELRSDGVSPSLTCLHEAPIITGSAQEASQSFFVPTAGIPRRLTPRECERLMGWPDDHTLVLGPKGKPMSDAARYKMIGNGVASPVVQWIAGRLLQHTSRGSRRCRTCKRDDSARHRAANIDNVREYQRAWARRRKAS